MNLPAGKKIKTLSGKSHFYLVRMDDKVVRYKNKNGVVYSFLRKRLDLVLNNWKKIDASVNREVAIQALWTKNFKSGNTRDEVYCAAIAKAMQE